MVGSAILDEITRRVKGAEMYAIMADETPDFSKTEQLAVLVRYVWNGMEWNGRRTSFSCRTYGRNHS